MTLDWLRSMVEPVIGSVGWIGDLAMNITQSQTGNPLTKIAMVSKAHAVTLTEGHGRFVFRNYFI